MRVKRRGESVGEGCGCLAVVCALGGWFRAGVDMLWAVYVNLKVVSEEVEGVRRNREGGKVSSCGLKWRLFWFCTVCCGLVNIGNRLRGLRITANKIAVSIE